MKKSIMFLWLLSAVGLSGGEMKIPARWQPPKMIAGRDYRVGLFPRNYVIDDPEMMAIPLHRDAIWNIRRTSSHRIDFIGKLMNNPQSHSGSAVMKTSNPLLLHTTCYYTEKEEDVAIPDSSFQSLKKAAGNRLLGTIAAELGYADHYFFARQFKQKTGVTPGKFRDEGHPGEETVP